MSHLVKNPDGTDIIPSDEFRWSTQGPGRQIHSLHLHVGAPGIFSDLLRSAHMLKRDRMVRKATGSCRTYSISGKTAALVDKFAVEDLRSAELQPRFLCLQWMTCPLAEHSMIYIYLPSPSNDELLLSIFYLLCLWMWVLTDEVHLQIRLPDKGKFLTPTIWSRPGLAL